MASLQASAFFCSSCSLMSSGSQTHRQITRAVIDIPKLRKSNLTLPKLPTTRGVVEEVVLKGGHNTTTTTKTHKIINTNVSDPLVMSKLYALMEAVSDRVEMHANICEQRNNWNSLLLASINAITLGAATMAGIAAAMGAVGTPLLALKMSSSLMYLAVTGMLIVMNKLQPSQLAEEQRNATRLFKQLRSQIQTTIAIGSPTTADVEDVMRKVLALDRAYPLPLLGVMLEKFPSAVEPAVWWPQKKAAKSNTAGSDKNGNGWSVKLEEEMREIVEILEKNDKDDYLKLGKKALKINKIMAISGPVLTGIAAVGSAFVGHGWSAFVGHGSSWGAMLGVAAGALASVVNTLEHGGQVGMVVELYRGNAGFFEEMEETIESNLKEKDENKRENGELFEMKVALQLGRSLSELRDLAAKGHNTEEFGSKLF